MIHELVSCIEWFIKGPFHKIYLFIYQTVTPCLFLRAARENKSFFHNNLEIIILFFDFFCCNVVDSAQVALSFTDTVI